MRFSEHIKPIAFMKTKAAQLIKLITEGKTPMIITQNGEAKVVIQDIQTYERDRKALLALKLFSQGVADTEKGRCVDQDKIFDRLERDIRSVRDPS